MFAIVLMCSPVRYRQYYLNSTPYLLCEPEVVEFINFREGPRDDRTDFRFQNHPT